MTQHHSLTPDWGSIQDAQMTLLTRQGNAFDTSSLLIALLRAAGRHPGLMDFHQAHALSSVVKCGIKSVTATIGHGRRYVNSADRIEP